MPVLIFYFFNGNCNFIEVEKMGDTEVNVLELMNDLGKQCEGKINDFAKTVQVRTFDY
jgi:hypothetical protein